MAAIMGKDGFVSATSSTSGSTSAMVYIDSWTLNPGVGTAEVTAFGDSWEAHKATIKNWNATASGTLETTGTGQSEMVTKIVSNLNDVYPRFYVDNTTDFTYWGGAAILESWSINSAVKDRVGISMNFKGNGALSYTTAT